MRQERKLTPLVIMAFQGLHSADPEMIRSGARQHLDGNFFLPSKQVLLRQLKGMLAASPTVAQRQVDLVSLEIRLIRFMVASNDAEQMSLSIPCHQSIRPPVGDVPASRMRSHAFCQPFEHNLNIEAILAKIILC